MSAVQLQQTLASSQLGHFAHHIYHGGVLAPDVLWDMVHPGGSRKVNGTIEPVFDWNNWAVLHAWHVDSFWASVQTHPSLRFRGQLDPVPFEDSTFVLDRHQQMHRYHLQPADMAFWFGGAAERATGGAVKAAVHTVLLHRRDWGLLVDGYERHVTLMHLWPAGPWDGQDDGQETMVEEPCVRLCERNEYAGIQESWPGKIVSFGVRTDVML
mmetsp:Transcript_277/g.549  ORF Transcript_277/g.549 Transcript_277/m.549 type:complete len:212 (+) Transcript_277:1-636(+)